MAEAGWYHVEGDPPGTVRRWNGVEWIGFAIPDPNGATAMHGARPTTRKRFNSGDRVLSVVAVLVLTGLAGVFALTSWRFWQGAELAGAGFGDDPGDVRDLGKHISGLGALTLAIIFGTVISAFVFIPWLRAAAATAEIHRLSTGRGGPKRERISLFVWILLFLIFPGPTIVWLIVRAAAAGIARGSNQSASLLGVVSDTAMAASTDPRTGMAGISPVKIMIWWAFWWLPMIAGTLLWTAVWILSPITASTLQTVVQINAILLALEVVSLLCIVATIIQISGRLWR